MTTYIDIKAVSLAPGATITKGTTNAGRPGFTVPIIYTLEDGREIASHSTRERKKHVLEAVESENSAAQRGELAASFEDGAFWGTRQTCRIGL